MGKSGRGQIWLKQDLCFIPLGPLIAIRQLWRLCNILMTRKLDHKIAKAAGGAMPGVLRSISSIRISTILIFSIAIISSILSSIVVRILLVLVVLPACTQLLGHSLFKQDSLKKFFVGFLACYDWIFCWEENSIIWIHNPPQAVRIKTPKPAAPTNGEAVSDHTQDPSERKFECQNVCQQDLVGSIERPERPEKPVDFGWKGKTWKKTY